MRDIDPNTGRPTATDKRAHFRMAVGTFTDPRKFADIADPIERAATLALHAASVDYCRGSGTDGHFDPVELCNRMGLPAEIAKNVIVAGGWHQTDHSCTRCPQPRTDRVYLHDYLEHNRSAAQEQRILDKRRAGGKTAAAGRWSNHIPEPKPKRPPGRPRKHPKPDPVAELFTLADQVFGPADQMHPAEARARAANRPGRPRTVPTTVFEPVVLELCEELKQIVQKNGFSVGKLGPAWWKPCEQLLRIGPPNAKEAVTPEQIRTAMQWMNSDAFWWQNVRSMQQLREKYEQLRACAKDPTRAKRGQAGAVRRMRQMPPPSLPQNNSLFDDDDYTGAP